MVLNVLLTDALIKEVPPCFDEAGHRCTNTHYTIKSQNPSYI